MAKFPIDAESLRIYVEEEVLESVVSGDGVG